MLYKWTWRLRDAFAVGSCRSHSMGDFFYRNVRADECSAPGTGPGAMLVRYQGEEYAVIGVYFTGARSGRHVICYVLRELLGSREAVSPPRGGPGRSTPSITEGPEHGVPPPGLE